MDRERRPNGNDYCAAGHTYPSSHAVTNPLLPVSADIAALVAEDARRERAAVVAFVRARLGMYDGELRSDEAVVRALQYLVDEIERGEHRREEET